MRALGDRGIREDLSANGKGVLYLPGLSLTTDPPPPGSETDTMSRAQLVP
jgi:hypothetical protein